MVARAHAFWGFLCALTSAGAVFCLVSHARAQIDAGPAPLDVGQPEGQPPTPPSIVSLPTIEVPAPTESIQVIVIVEADGHAELEHCEAGPELCEVVRQALPNARFVPATRDGQAVRSRVGLTLRASAPEPTGPESGLAQGANGATDGLDAGVAGADAAVEPQAEWEFGARARVARPLAGTRRLELEELREMPGAFGDPFRAIDALPSVTPVLSGLPYVYIRGAPPSGTLYVYDDIPVPSLYHLAAGPAVLHPRMVGPIRLHTGVPPARYGRLTGGAIVGEAPEESPPDAWHGELELRLLDINAYLEAPLRKHGTFAAAVRYGYPGLLLSIFSPAVSLAYWDYQLRMVVPFNDGDQFQLVWFGSYDSFTQKDEDTGEMDSSLYLQFHRMEARFVRQRAHLKYGVALRFGYEESALDNGNDSADSDLGMHAWTFGPRIWLEAHNQTLRFRVGADLIGNIGQLTNRDGDGLEDVANDPLTNAVAARSTGGAYTELTWQPDEQFELQTGLRVDAWSSGSDVSAGIDPRVRLVFHPTSFVDTHIAMGFTHQPAVFLIPLPGISEVALEPGLQTGEQVEVGLGVDAPGGYRLETQAFAHYYKGLVFYDAQFQEDACSGCSTSSPPSRINGRSYGVDFFFRKEPSEHDWWHGFLSYTLAWSRYNDVFGLHYTPTYDIRHVLNLVLGVDLGKGFSVGLRGHLRSGRMLGTFELAAPPGQSTTQPITRYEQRLPLFYRIDANIAYAWSTSWGALRLSLEWFNVTLSKEAISLECDDEYGDGIRPCKVSRGPAIFFPNLSLRATF